MTLFDAIKSGMMQADNTFEALPNVTKVARIEGIEAHVRKFIAEQLLDAIEAAEDDEAAEFALIRARHAILGDDASAV